MRTLSSFRLLLGTGVSLVAVTSCAPTERQLEEADSATLIAQYAPVRLTTDLGQLSEQQRAMLVPLIEAAHEMNGLFWEQAFGSRDSLVPMLRDPNLRRYAEINYGPWDRLAGNAPFVSDAGPKPAGANFYPRNMSREGFEAFVSAHPDLADRFRSQYTLVKRGLEGVLEAIPYHEAFEDRLQTVAEKLRAAAALAEDRDLQRYLTLRAEALLTDEYRVSDMAWLDMKQNAIDIVIGPIETYEDQLFGYKAAYEGLVLVKDRAWSRRLSRYASLLPGLQRRLPVPDAYRQETPGAEAELNAYDAVYFAGDANAGSKPIAVNLPNDEVVQLEKGTRRLQLKNAMRAKFDEILVPIADMLLAEDQRQHITFDAFFANTMFHEVAHGLGIKNTLTGQGTVREALREHASAMEEGKADILGLWMITTLYEDGEITDGDVRDNYVTFLASVFRSVRFGASSAHGKANMVRFNFFAERGVFGRDEVTGRYRVDFDRLKEAVAELSEALLTIQGDGDYEGAATLISQKGVIGPMLQTDLDRLTEASIPVDIVFEQGVEQLRP
jgi:hypothetical protein